MLDDVLAFALSLPGSSESFPFGKQTAVLKVGGKMFAAINLDAADRINLKCEPDHAQELRAQYPDCVLPGYHMNKKHWNTVLYTGRLDLDDITEMIKNSYDLVLQSLPKQLQKTILDS